MGIAQKVARDFADGVRARGQSYFAKGRVVITSAKAGEIVVLDKAESADGKTKGLRERFGKLELTNALIIDGAEIEPGFARAARNIPNIDVLPVQGINVYDILRRKRLVLTKAAVEALEARFK